MKKTDMLVYREKLHSIRARLRGDVTAMAEVALRKSGMEGADSNAMPIHMAELGSDNFEQEFTLGLMEAEATELLKKSTRGTRNVTTNTVIQYNLVFDDTDQESLGIGPLLRAIAADPSTYPGTIR